MKIANLCNNILLNLTHTNRIILNHSNKIKMDRVEFVHELNNLVNYIITMLP